MLAPSNRIRWVKVNNGKYEITPAMLCKNGFAAVLPDMTEDKVLAFKDDVEPSHKILWADLVALRDADGLTPGKKYRITDYVTTTTATSTSSAGKRFDVIVEALSGNELSARAKACHHDWFDEPGLFKLIDTVEGASYDLSPYVSEEALASEALIVIDMVVTPETVRIVDEVDETFYYVGVVDIQGTLYGKLVPYEYIENPSSATRYLLKATVEPDFVGVDVGAWELEYCLDNDADRFDWADETNGKGVVYRLVDEWGNDCPYDFKNIRYDLVRGESDVYTFSCVQSNQIVDASLNGLGENCCNGNKMAPYRIEGKRFLNRNTFVSAASSLDARGNSFGEDAHSNTLGTGAVYCSFGAECAFVELGNHCVSLTFEDRVYSIEFRDPNDKDLIDYVQDVVVERNCSSLFVYSADTVASFENTLRNVRIHMGVAGASIAVPDRNLAYSTDYYATGSQTVNV